VKAATIKTAIYLAIIAGGWAWVQNEDFKAEQQIERTSLDQAGKLISRVKKCPPIDKKNRPLTGTLVLTADWQMPEVRCIYKKTKVA
jgi:hypothetical protein